MENIFYNYKGGIHIHSKLSDGTGDINTITKAANKAGLAWIIITDHNHYDTEEGIINDIYVMKGEEISPHSSNHYLAFGIDRTISPDIGVANYVSLVREFGGFGFAAHPDEGTEVTRGINSTENIHLPQRKNSYHCIPWDDKNITPDGIEIWNWFSNWADNLNDKNIFTLAYAYFFKHKIITTPYKTTLKWWDKLNNETESIVPAIGGIDAHALKIYKYIIPLTVFPYKTCFSTITNTIFLEEKLSKNFDIAKKQILNAIRNGNNIIANLNTCKDIPQIYIENNNKNYFCGNTVELAKNCCLHFESKEVFKTCLIYNGNEIEQFNSNEFTYPISQCGKYRLEVYYKDKGFLYTNPFNVR